MVRRIRLLDDALVDQIAAGEVVERPASAVKELLENSLDAGAETIEVAVRGGGVDQIRISDDGCGMSREEAPMALRRHATSKIATAADLTAIATLGFRGEALPSIASVSRLTLTTRAADAVAGTRVEVVAGGEPAVGEVGCAVGTTVEVRDLFHNVPARRKFLKSKATENAHVTEVCLRIALSAPQLRLTLLREGRMVREYLPATGYAERAATVFGGEALSAISGTRDGVTVHAFLGPPEKSRAGATGLHVFVNGRPVRERSLARAVAFAYGSVLPPGRYPIGVVYIEVPPSSVDVNVHPQKTEVRFARGREVLDAVTRLLAKELGTTAWSSVRPPPARGPTTGPGSPSSVDATAPDLLRELASEAYRAAEATPLLSSDRGPFGSLRVLAQVRRMLIVCEGSDALYVLDQHAADERVRYARLRRSYDAREVATQRLLFPERVEVTDAEAARVEEHNADLETVGMQCSLVGPTTVAVHAVPMVVRRAPPERLLRDLLDELAHLGDRGFGDRVDTALATMACHGAIRAGDALSDDECAALLRALDDVEQFGGHCPHGRPVVMKIDFDDIERRLGR